MATRQQRRPLEQGPATGGRRARGFARPARIAPRLKEPGATLLVLRAFLGVTFSFAGLQKLANPAFFQAGAPASFAAQLRGAVVTSPLHRALDFALHAPTLIAVLIALGELAVGLGTLVGLFGRIAALFGMVLSLSFFLTVSFHDSPYYYGADIVFLFAWTPFLLGGSGALSLDALLARVRNRPPLNTEVDLERRNVLRRIGAAAGLGVVTLVLAEMDSAIGQHRSTKSAAPTTTTSSTPAGGGTESSTPAGVTSGETRIGPASSIPVGGALAFTDQLQGIPAFCVHKSSGDFVAFSAICTHAGCTVGFDESSEEFLCPCHGSIYNALTGAVVQGPAPTSLPSINVRLTSAGELYATD